MAVYAVGEFAILAFRARNALEEVGRGEDHVGGTTSCVTVGVVLV
jgi:hypothetical protein